MFATVWSGCGGSTTESCHPDPHRCYTGLRIDARAVVAVAPGTRRVIVRVGKAGSVDFAPDAPPPVERLLVTASRRELISLIARDESGRTIFGTSALISVPRSRPSRRSCGDVCVARTIRLDPRTRALMVS